MNGFLPRFAGALLCCATFPATPALAQTGAVRSVDLPSEPLGRALPRFTRSTGVIVVADAALIRGKRTQPVKGQVTAEVALRQMLEGTGLRATPDGHGGFVLMHVIASSSVPTSAADVPPVEPQAEILVFGRLARDTTFTIPQSVELLDNTLLEAVGNKTVGDVLRFVPGASRDGSVLDAFGDTYLMRGFATNQTINGIAANTLRQARDTVSIERVEVLKGPASVLYGQLQPGAVVNLVTKQPQRVWGGNASLSYGRFDEWRGTLDVTGPLTADGGIRFRVTGAYDDSDSFVDYWHRKHFVVAPVLAFGVGNDTTVTIESLYTRNELRGFYNGVPAEGSVLPNSNGPLPRSLGLSDPTLPPSIRENSDISARVEHRFSETVNWRTALSWTHEKVREATVFGLLGWADDTQRPLLRAVLGSRGSGDNWTAHTDLGLRAATGPIDHEIVIGGDYTWFDRSSRGTTGLLPDLDLYAPAYSLNNAPTVTPIASRDTTTRESSRGAGLFAQDRIGIVDRLKLIAGLRWSDYRQTVISTRGSGAAITRAQTQTSWTSQIGLLFTPSDRVSLFANRTTSFLPVQGITVTGAPLKPETGTQYEVGAKVSAIDGRVTLTGALFHLQRGDVAVADRVNPAFLLAIGKQVAKGVELSATARPVPGLNLYAGYAYTDASTTEDTDASLVGKRIRNIPEQSLVLRGDYDIRSGALTGLSMGGSATYTGKRSGDIEDSFALPGFWRGDLNAGYAITPHVTVSASIENLFDERYYTQAYSQFEVWPGAPRTWRVAVSTRF